MWLKEATLCACQHHMQGTCQHHMQGTCQHYMQGIQVNLAGSIFDMGEEGPQVCGPACCLGPSCRPRGIIATYFCTHATFGTAATRRVDQVTTSSNIAATLHDIAALGGYKNIITVDEMPIPWCKLKLGMPEDSLEVSGKFALLSYHISLGCSWLNEALFSGGKSYPDRSASSSGLCRWIER